MQLRENRSGFWRIRLMSMEALGAWAALVLMVLLKHFMCCRKGLMGQEMGDKEPGRGGRVEVFPWLRDHPSCGTA